MDTIKTPFLSVKFSTANKFEQQLYGRNQPTVSLKSLRGKKRILTICGPTDLLLKDVLVPFRVFFVGGVLTISKRWGIDIMGAAVPRIRMWKVQCLHYL